LKTKYYGQPIGFLLGSPSPNSHYSSSPSPRPPATPHQSQAPISNGANLLPAQRPNSTFGAGGSQKDMGLGDLDIGELVKNAGQIIEIIKQVGPLVHNLMPLIEVLKNFNAKKSKNLKRTTSRKKPRNKPNRRRKRTGKKG
jgi:hypothetical protein